MSANMTAVLALVVASGAATTPAQASSGRLVGGNEFDAPSALTLAGGHLWVANESGNSVTEINPANGGWIRTIPRTNGYRFARPVAMTNDGPDLFVANSANSVTEMSSGNGKFVRFIEGSKYRFSHPAAVAVSGKTLLVLNSGSAGTSGSITEISTQSGRLLRVIKGSAYQFSDPLALAVSGGDVYVSNKSNNTVTEVSIARGTLVRVVSGQGLDAPDGIAVESGNVWVADSASNSATDINAATGEVVATYTDAEGQYGFGQPGAVIAAQGSVYIASPFGTSPMVTRVSATSGVPSWFMCNTNGPYYFSLLSSFAVSGNNLWVASRSGANSATTAAATGSLTEMSLSSGALITTVPAPTGTSTTTTTTP